MHKTSPQNISFRDRFSTSVLTPEQMNLGVFKETNPLLLDWRKTREGQNLWMRLEDLYWLPLNIKGRTEVSVVFPSNLNLSPVERTDYQVKFAWERASGIRVYGLVPTREMFFQRMSNPEAQYPLRDEEKLLSFSRTRSPGDGMGKNIRVIFADEL